MDLLAQEEKYELPMGKTNRYETEENAIFFDFSQTNMRDIIVSYPSLTYHHRISLCKNLDTALGALSEPEGRYALLKLCAKDNEDVQVELIDFLSNSFRKQPIRQDYRHYFVDPLSVLLEGHHLKVKEDAATLLSEVAIRMQLTEKKELLQLAKALNNSREQENKIVGIQLFAKLAHLLPQNEVEGFFTSNYFTSFSDLSVRVRKQILAIIGLLCDQVSQEYLEEKLIEDFVVLNSKDNVWGVRKVCVEALPSLIRQSQHQKDLLSSLMTRFLQDGNRIVRVAAFKILPQFIANYGNDRIPESLFAVYLNLLENDVNRLASREYEVTEQVAKFFPNVLMSVGARRWCDLSRLFAKLMSCPAEKVKLPLAESLHIICGLIGPELGKEHLFPALDHLLKDHSDPPKLAAISHLAEFVQQFDPVTRENLIDVFLVLQKDPKKWRIRYLIAAQLGLLAKIYSSLTVFQYIFPISMKLCNDSVWEVRNQASLRIAQVIEQLKEQPQLRAMALESVLGYAYSQKSSQRQVFAQMLPTLIHIADFQVPLIAGIRSLACDAVSIVKMAVVIALKRVLKQSPTKKDKLDEIIQMMKMDTDDLIAEEFKSNDSAVMIEEMQFTDKDYASTPGKSTDSPLRNLQQLLEQDSSPPSTDNISPIVSHDLILGPEDDSPIRGNSLVDQVKIDADNEMIKSQIIQPNDLPVEDAPQSVQNVKQDSAQTGIMEQISQETQKNATKQSEQAKTIYEALLSEGKIDQTSQQQSIEINASKIATTKTEHIVKQSQQLLPVQSTNQLIKESEKQIIPIGQTPESQLTSEHVMEDTEIQSNEQAEKVQYSQKCIVQIATEQNNTESLKIVEQSQQSNNKQQTISYQTQAVETMSQSKISDCQDESQQINNSQVVNQSSQASQWSAALNNQAQQNHQILTDDQQLSQTQANSEVVSQKQQFSNEQAREESPKDASEQVSHQ